MIFFTSDTHFNHKNILTLGTGRPYDDINHHNEMLVRNWNTTVEEEDIVYHLGDVALGSWPDGLEYVKRLNGTKILIPGNHDRVSSLEKEARRERFTPDYLNVFDDILDEVVLHLMADGTQVILSHYPYEGDSHDGDRHAELRPFDRGTPLLHGHTHSSEVVSRSKHGTLQIQVGVDANGYRPVSEKAISTLLNTLNV